MPDIETLELCFCSREQFGATLLFSPSGLTSDAITGPVLNIKPMHGMQPKKI